MPGPVKISPKVRAALAARPLSHRGGAFAELHGQCKDALLRLGKSKHVILLMGSGTAANAMVAQELKKLPGRGLVLANGEFGARLAAQGARAGLDFDTHRVAWGGAFAFEGVREKLRGKSWLWLAHCETSTGAVNLDARLAAHCKAQNIKLCLDSVSALGNQEVDFSGVYLASGVSGKGLCAVPGVAMVFYNHAPKPARTGLDYLDLAVYHGAAGVPFTFSSNLLAALRAALSATDYTRKFARNARHAARVGEWLAANKLRTPLTHAQQADYVWTLALPKRISSPALGVRLEQNGVFVNHRNRYLARRNWIQIALMGVCGTKELAAALDIFGREMGRGFSTRGFATPEITG